MVLPLVEGDEPGAGGGAGQPLPTVQLRHELPDGSWHIDWLIARDPAGEQPLVTFRLPRPLDEIGAGDGVAAERIPDHRPRYLTYEGPLTGPRVRGLAGGRGRVRRVGSGALVECRPTEPGPPAPGGGAWRLRVAWEAAAAPFEQVLRLEPAPGPRGRGPGGAGGKSARWRVIVLACGERIGYE